MENHSVKEIFIFGANPLQKIVEKHGEAYKQASPYPHAIIDNFLPEEVAQRILREFPNKDREDWLDWRSRDPVHQQGKLEFGMAGNIGLITPYLHHLLLEFNSFTFVSFLERLTGITSLIPDPHFLGGAFHQIVRGGRLAIHADYNYHKILKIFRRVNVLYYLNPDWKTEYGAELELWNEDMTECVQKIEPRFNRCVVFNTGEKAFHGHPTPLAAPPEVTRKSMAFYYYHGSPAEEEGMYRLPIWQQEWPENG